MSKKHITVKQNYKIQIYLILAPSFLCLLLFLISLNYQNFKYQLSLLVKKQPDQQTINRYIHAKSNIYQKNRILASINVPLINSKGAFTSLNDYNNKDHPYNTPPISQEITTPQENLPAEIKTVNITYPLKVPILMYHYIRVNPVATDTIGYGLSVTPNDFQLQMQYLYSHGYNTITVTQLIKALNGKEYLPPMPVIITFDDGYEDFYTTALPILEEYNFKSEVFIITHFVGRPSFMTWDMIKNAYSTELVTIGSHTLNHLDLSTLPLSVVDNELTKSKYELQDELGTTITDFCYPEGGYNVLDEQEVAKAGYEDALTTRNGIDHYPNNYYGLTRIRVAGGEKLSQFISTL